MICNSNNIQDCKTFVVKNDAPATSQGLAWRINWGSQLCRWHLAASWIKISNIFQPN